MRIQQAILPSNDFIGQSLDDFFVLFLPKDIVSGDFYWVDSVGDTVLFAAVDCTGHGVPGAFMSIVGSNLLNAAVHEDGLIKPAEILNYLSVGVSATLQKDDDRKVKDGMDLTLCALNMKTMEVEYAGAYNPLIHVRNKEATQHKVDVYPIGQPFSERFEGYNSYKVKLEKGDTLYVFSDGYQDQFGGPKGKKFMKKRLREMLASISDKPMQEQREYLHQTFEDWKKEGDKDQIDDVIIFGVRV
jgi:serine phosphatase RsbU (regulator of sigma subunit)